MVNYSSETELWETTYFNAAEKSIGLRRLYSSRLFNISKCGPRGRFEIQHELGMLGIWMAEVVQVIFLCRFGADAMELFNIIHSPHVDFVS